MVVLVAFAQSLKDLDGFGDGRLVHLDRLESTFQRGVLFDVLAVFVGGGGADGLEFASGEHRLEHVGCAERTVRGTCADDCVDLVDEQHDVATALDFLEHFLEALFEVAAVARSGHHGAEVERVHLLVFEGFRHVARVDFLREAFDDGGFADAGFADQHWVVFGAAAQHDHDAFDFLRAADHRVKLACGGFGGEVAAELFEDRGGGPAVLVGHATGVRQLAFIVAAGCVAANHVDGGRTQFAQVHVHFDEYLGTHAFAFADQAEQDVLGTDVAVAELQRFAQAEFQHLLGVRGEGDVPVG